MIIKSIDLKEYRNYHHLHVELDPKMNIIIGTNGIGKTNILESLTVVSNTKSFRTNDDQELIHNNEEYARIEVNVDNTIYRVIINKSGKALFINQTAIKRSSDFIGKLNVVLFEPSDLELFGASPRTRRRLIDLELGKTSKDYLNALLVYNKLIKEKNNLLKNEKVDELLLETINERLVAPISKIIRYRQAFIDYINQYISEYFKKISNTEFNIRIDYKKAVESDELAIKEMLKHNIQKDILYRCSTVGPHKDDIIFYFDEHLIVNYASQGQKRMTMVAFKLALIQYIIAKTKTTPVLLLDDILSELDLLNKERMLNMIPPGVQTIITSTDVNGIKLKDEYRLFNLKKG